MAIEERYRQQVDLLVRVLPSVSPEEVFALKGGTAINLFVRNLPRLSVDIDLTYLPIRPRADSLSESSKRSVGYRHRSQALSPRQRCTRAVCTKRVRRIGWSSERLTHRSRSR
ncbi:nucleotidyl transferase AbiEii/AbiGii toxin family protein [Vannielia litorea]|uniref:nucleotidyl transferase AbiEii/AbiGii toxin family protein n=1 Tax=Vannielia litorea TaxID=1217970 RepID=UPI00237ACD1B|nr:nucleotidyl transferase AbiEii/AbiGii toxin family protein [Vannielia litorea]